MLAVIILTFNSRNVIRGTVEAALQVSRVLGGTIYVVDSGSSDGTPEIAKELGCEFTTRPFTNYADQRNWAIENLGNNHAWQLHLDADEQLDGQAVASISACLQNVDPRYVYLLKRRTYFMGKELRFGGTGSWHLRLFKTGAAACENRLYDQHFVSDLPSRKLRGALHDLNVGTLAEWTARHNRWSDLEAEEIGQSHAARTGQVPGRLSADPRERRRLYKGAYYSGPPFWRAVGYFLYRYVVMCGWADGRVGFIYAVLQALWFRVLVDAKIAERAMAAELPRPLPPHEA